MNKIHSYMVLFFGTILSKGAGFLREILFSAWFGTGDTATAFRIAQTAYLLPVQALVGDTLSAGLLPLYNKLKEQEDNRNQILIFCAILYALFLSLTISSLVYIFSETISLFIAPNSNNNVILLSSQFIKILALSIPFYILGGTLSFIETAYGYFSGIAIRPILLNIFSIIGVCFSVYFKIDIWLAVSILCSHILFLLLTFLKLRKIGKILPNKNIKINLVKEVFVEFIKNMYPLLGLPIIVQVSVISERIISSNIGVGVIPAVDYARFVCETAVQLIAVPLGIITMASFNSDSRQVLKEYVEKIFTILILITTPISLFLYQNSELIIRFIFHRGAFDEKSVQLTSSVFQWMSIGLTFTLISYFLIKVLNTLLLNKLALIFTLLGVLVSISINFSLWKILGVDVIGLSVLGYSFIIFLLCLFYFSLGKIFLKLYMYLIPFLLFQYFIFININQKSIIELFIYFILVVMIWCFIFGRNKHVSDFFKKIYDKFNKNKGSV